MFFVWHLFGNPANDIQSNVHNILCVRTTPAVYTLNCNREQMICGQKTDLR